MPHGDPTVGVAEASASLRAVKEGAEESVHFGAGPVELEFLVEVSREGGGGDGVRFWVLSAEARPAPSATHTHRVKLSLVPLSAEGEDLEVTDEVGARPSESGPEGGAWASEPARVVQV